MISLKKILDSKDIEIIENRFNTNRCGYQNYNNSIINNISKKNVDYYIVKPYGKKCYLWFTYINKEFIALIKYINCNEFYKVDINFDNTLSYNNVLLCGYYCNITDNLYFVLDNIINYNNYNDLLDNKKFNMQSMFNIYNNIFNNINNNNNNNSKIKIYLPFITNNYNSLFNNIYNIAYLPYAISLWYNNKNIGLYFLNNKSISSEAIFKITADTNHDTYNLYYLDNNSYKFHSRCLISNYKLSVYMNSLFRNIVENTNLDLLEESEDEDSFQNTNENKFVDLDKYLFFKCYYNKRFKKWVPKILIDNIKNYNVITKKELLYIEKK